MRRYRTRAAIGRRRLNQATLRAWRARLRPGDEVHVSGFGRGVLVETFGVVGAPPSFAVVRLDRRPPVEYSTGNPACVKVAWCQPVRRTPQRGE